MHSKKALERLSRTRLILALLSILSVLKATNPAAYKRVEKDLFKKKVATRNSRNSRKRHGPRSRKRASKKQLAARRKFKARVKNARKLMKAGYKGSWSQALKEYGG